MRGEYATCWLCAARRVTAADGTEEAGVLSGGYIGEDWYVAALAIWETREPHAAQIQL